MDYTIRNEQCADYRTVEDVTRKAFWNIHAPGCDEHYLVHVMRHHRDFIPELDFVIEKNGQIIGNIMYTKSRLVSDKGIEKEILTFGPVSILPEYQRRGYGRKLIEHSFVRAIELNYDAIVIFGNPGNYVNLGFKSCKRFDITTEDGKYPTGMLVRELVEGSLSGGKWTYKESDAYHFNEKDADAFDSNFEEMEKKFQASQEEFYILSSSEIK